eukprot:Lankesteria_metandrocarpae@DN5398_c0_g1_i1.p1
MCKQRWSPRAFPGRVTKDCSNYISNPEVMSWCRSLFFGKIEDDTSIWGRGMQPKPSDLQPHNYVLREAIAEWIIGRWSDLQQPWCADDLADCDGEGVSDDYREFIQDRLVTCVPWTEAIPLRMSSHEILPMCPFIMLHATVANYDNPLVKANYLFNLNDYNMAPQDIAAYARGFSHEPSDNNKADVDTRGELTRSMGLMCRCADGVVRLRVRTNDEHDFSVGSPDKEALNLASRLKRHCAEWYFPDRVLRKFSTAAQCGASLKAKEGKITQSGYDALLSFVESSNFESEEVSVYMLGVEIGPYVTGVLWFKEQES